MDNEELADICATIEEEYDENDDEFTDDITNEDLPDTSKDSGVSSLSTGSFEENLEDLDSYLETAWRDVENEVNAQICLSQKVKNNSDISPSKSETTNSEIQKHLIESTDNDSKTTYKPSDIQIENILEKQSKNIENISTSETNNSKDEINVWVPDSFLHASSGWMIKKYANRKTFVSPDGKQESESEKHSLRNQRWEVSSYSDWQSWAGTEETGEENESAKESEERSWFVSTTGVSVAIEEKSPPTTSTPTNTVATKFKMDYLDMERNKDLSGMKDSLLKLEQFKRSFTSSDKTITSKTEDIDFDAL